MVCKECGAYNAEHLSHCRVCAARLTDTDEPVQQEETTLPETEAPRDPDLPKRDFVRAPKWPKQAYSGAKERPVPEPPKEEAEESFTSSFDEAEEKPASAEKTAPAARSAAVAKPLADRKLSTATEKPAAKPANAEEKNPGGARFCPYCGKPLLPDAPFCPYCGKNAGLPTVFDEPAAEDEKPAAAPVSRTAKAAPAPARRSEPRKPAPIPAPVDADDEDDEDEDDDDIFGDDKKPARRTGLSRFASRGAKALPADEDDEDDIDDDEYDDEYDDDVEEEEELPKKRGGKSTTILFWSLIVLLVALIAVFGMYIVKKNYGGDIGNLFAALSGNKPAATDAPNTTDPGSAGGSTADNPLFGTGTIEENPEDASEFLVTVYAPTGSTVLLVTPTELMNGGKTTIPSLDKVGLRVPKTAFLPNMPLDSPTITIQPDIRVTTPTGESYQVEINEISMTAEALSLTLTEPLTDTVNARYGNQPITVKGTVSDEYASVYVNGTQTTVYVGGEFSAEFTPTGSAEAETVTIEARKNNMVTASYTLTVVPYVEQNMALAVTNDLTSLASTTGKATLTGTVTPGAALTASCASSNVVCGTVSVSAAGNFSVNVTASDVGAFPIVITAKQEGYKDAEATVYVEHWPEASTSSQKTSWKKKCTTLSAAEHKKLVDGTNSVTNYTFTGKVTEIVGNNGLYTIVKMELTSGEVVYLANRSKNTLASDDVNKKKIIAGSYAGFYADTKLPLVFGWYIWNVT